MKRAAFVLLILILLPSAAIANKRVALVIGNGDYAKVGKLPNPTSDAIAVGTMLRAAKFELVEIKNDLGVAALRRALRDFSDHVRDAEIAMVFYAGHGIEVNGTNYLIPVDATLERDLDVEDETVSLDRVTQILDPAKRLRIVILDACRDNPFVRSMKRTVSGRSIGRGLAKVDVQTSDTLIAFAAKAGFTAGDGEGANSPFTVALLKHLTTPGLDLRLALGRVRDEVLKSTGNKQEPAVYSLLGGTEIALVAGTAPPGAGTAPPTQPQLSEAAQTWALIKDNTNQAVLEAYARQFGDTVYGVMAHARIEELKKQQVAVATPPSTPESKPAPQAKPAVSTTPQAPMPQPSLSGILKVGLAGPLTGPNAAFGLQLKNGAEQGVADINAMGGINGQKIQLVFGDDASDPRQGVSVANKMRDEGVKFVIGHFNSAVTMAASEVYQESGTYLITPSATNPKITERGMWNVFRTSGRDDRQSEVAAAYILSKFKGKKIAIAHDKTIYGQGLAEATKKAMVNGGMQEVLYESTNRGERDYSVLVAKIKGSGADLVYWGGLYPEGGLIVKQMREQGVKARFMGGDGLATDEFPAIGGTAVDGTLMTFNPDPRNNPAAAKIVRTFAAKNINPEAFTLYSYAALQVIALAAADSRSLDPRKVAEATKSGKAFKTVIGDLVYDSKGDITRPDYVMHVWRKGANGKITFTEE